MSLSADSAVVPAAPPGRLARVVGSPVFWFVVLAAGFALPLVRTVLRGRAALQPLPVLWQMPAWSLTDQRGQPFGSEQLRGQVYVANFIFTSCTMSCPRLTGRMAALQPRVRRYGNAVHLVSVSVDPANDTPERLRAYAAGFRADEALWSFATGPEETVMRAVAQGFRVGVRQPVRGPHGEFNPIELAHSNRFALVDARGQLRGSYEVDDAGLERLVTDVGRLVAERPGGTTAP